MRLCAVMIVARLRCFCFLGYSEVNFYYQVDSNRRLLNDIVMKLGKRRGRKGEGVTVVSR